MGLKIFFKKHVKPKFRYRYFCNQSLIEDERDRMRGSLSKIISFGSDKCRRRVSRDIQTAFGGLSSERLMVRLQSV